jgi:hypothetical protein
MPVHAANPQNLDIHVSISNTKDLTVSSTYYNFGALAVNSSSVSTAITVTNPLATGLLETFTIKGDTATADGGGVNWVLASSTGTNQYALAAQFSDGLPADNTPAWDQDDLNSTSAVTATAAILGNGTAEQSGAAVSPNTSRSLWFRIRTPDVVSDPGHHKAVVVLSVL